jgi:hypothetical protein
MEEYKMEFHRYKLKQMCWKFHNKVYCDDENNRERVVRRK